MSNGCTRDNNCKKDAMLKAAKLKDKKSRGRRDVEEEDGCCGTQCTDRKRSDAPKMKVEAIPVGCTPADNCKPRKDRKK